MTTSSTRRRRVATAVCCAGALLAGCGDVAHEPAVAVPRVTGLRLPQAEQRLESRHLPWVLDPDGRVFRTARESSDRVNSVLGARDVVAQDPRPGRMLQAGGVVLLTLSHASTGPRR
jgi:beta-lactam-binding protein with PASTA domain